MKRPQSYSSISTYKKCPYLYEYKYVQGIKEPPHPKAERGTELHARLEEFFRGGPYPTAVKALAPWRRYMENLTNYNPEPELELAVDKDWHPCAYDAPEAYARGKLDLRYTVGDKRFILDWKSGKVYDSHEGQGKMYMALDEEVPEFVTEFVYLDMPLNTVSRSYKKGDRIIEIAKTINIIEIINADTEYKPTPSYDACEWCPRSWRRGGDCRSAP